jgi:hypothetical protein
MHPADFTALAEASRESGRGFTAFRTADRVLGLGWPLFELLTLPQYAS